MKKPFFLSPEVGTQLWWSLHLFSFSLHSKVQHFNRRPFPIISFFSQSSAHDRKSWNIVLCWFLQSWPGRICRGKDRQACFRMWGGTLTGRDPLVREEINWKNTFSFGHCPNYGGGSTHARIFGPLFRSAFFVNKKSLFLQKCQCIELLTVF